MYATELICSTGVLAFHTFKLALCIYNKLRLHAEILSWWAFDVTFPGSSPLSSNRSGLNVSNGGSWNPKFTLKVNSFWIKIKGQNFASQVLSRHTLKIPRKKGGDFFNHRGTLKLERTRRTLARSNLSVPPSFYLEFLESTNWSRKVRWKKMLFTYFRWLAEALRLSSNTPCRKHF